MRKDRGPVVTVTLPPVHRRSHRRDKLVIEASIIEINRINVEVSELPEGFILIGFSISVKHFFKRSEILIEVLVRHTSAQNAFSLEHRAPTGVVPRGPDVADTAMVVRTIDVFVALLFADAADKVVEGNDVSGGYLMRVFHGLKLLWRVRSDIRCIARLWHARASSRIFWRFYIHSAAVGTDDVGTAEGMPRGSYPIIK